MELPRLQFISLTGNPYVAGTGTTNFPLVYLNGGTAPTTLSTAGTYLGINAVSGFTGNFEDFHLNGGASVYSINYQGTVASASTITGTQLVSTISTGTAPLVVSSTTAVANLSIGGNAATATKWASARSLAGNSVDGSGNVAFANKFIVQGTSDAGLSSAQFLGSLSTGLMKVTTTTGVISNGASADVITLWSGSCSSSTYLRGDGSCQTPAGGSGCTASGAAGVVQASNGASGCQATLATDNGTTLAYTGTGGVVAPGFTSTSSSISGFFECGQGTANGHATANTITLECPASVTAYERILPGASATGVLHLTNAANVDTDSISAVVSADLKHHHHDLHESILDGDQRNGNGNLHIPNISRSAIRQSGYNDYGFTWQRGW